MNDKIQKLISLYEASYDSFQGVFVYMYCKAINTDFTSIQYLDNTFYFEFYDDEIEDFQIHIEDIRGIKFDKVADITISIIELYIGNTIMIFNL